jgi:hypothetical protein
VGFSAHLFGSLGADRGGGGLIRQGPLFRDAIIRPESVVSVTGACNFPEADFSGVDFQFLLYWTEKRTKAAFTTKFDN